MRRPDDAAEALRAALRIEPESAVALTNLGRVLLDREDPDLLDEAETLCRRAAALAPRLAQAINNLGNALRRQDRAEEAMACYERALRLDPRRVMPRYNLGQLFQQLGRYDEAARCCEVAGAIEPNPARYRANLGGLAAEREDHDEAARRYRLAAAADPRSAEAHHGLGLALLETGRHDDAEAALLEAIRLAPDRVAPLILMGRLQSERGDFDLACRSARKALALRPRCADAYCLLANILRRRLPDADIRAMRELLDQKHLGDRDRLHFSLAVVLDARGEYPAADALLEVANARQSSARAARGRPSDPDGHSGFIDRLIAAFTPELLSRGRHRGDPDPRPVFIVGLPRPGTTLVEQIIASHPLAHGAGELPDVPRIFHRLPGAVGRPFDDPFAALDSLGPAAARVAARWYLDRLDALARPAAARVVDPGTRLGSGLPGNPRDPAPRADCRPDPGPPADLSPFGGTLAAP